MFLNLNGNYTHVEIKTRLVNMPVHCSNHVLSTEGGKQDQATGVTDVYIHSKVMFAGGVLV